MFWLILDLTAVILFQYVFNFVKFEAFAIHITKRNIYLQCEIMQMLKNNILWKQWISLTAFSKNCQEKELIPKKKKNIFKKWKAILRFDNSFKKLIKLGKSKTKKN
ncbi:MAG: hypothetical protein MRECE_36c011 [Mycoplasmataceae bacterium CE_OT135]|nr:MAG: hypothetical protein MRECE_36c011 [Mycoplasmataceae bacterium CE_OT135]